MLGLAVVAIPALLVAFVGVTVAFWDRFSDAPNVCVSLPRSVTLWGVNVHDTGGGLYLCFQQGVDGDRTETRCVPMTKEKCSKKGTEP